VETTPIGGADFELNWPQQLFAQEATSVLSTSIGDWESRCEWLLIDAFTSSSPVDLFRARGEDPPEVVRVPTSRRRSQEDFVRLLIRQSSQLAESTTRAPYWLERRTGTSRGVITPATVVRQFVQMVSDLEGRGYFEQVFGKECTDDPSDVDPSSVLELHLGVANLWPLNISRLADDHDVLFGVVEVLHDLVSRPRSRSFHSWNQCGWHHSDFALEPGRRLYRWKVNRLLDRSDLGLSLADDGEDTGRLVAVTDDARTDLARSMASRADEGTGDRVRHALALFRGRTTTAHDKRSAVVALALVLEERRQLLKDSLFKKDEGALFDIANNFAIRHQRADQKTDYDPAFLDWVFWWYLATVELTDRILARSQGTAGA
jgi:hypothetical protein